MTRYVAVLVRDIVMTALPMNKQRGHQFGAVFSEVLAAVVAVAPKLFVQSDVHEPTIHFIDESLDYISCAGFTYLQRLAKLNVAGFSRQAAPTTTAEAGSKCCYNPI